MILADVATLGPAAIAFVIPFDSGISLGFTYNLSGNFTTGLVIANGSATTSTPTSGENISKLPMGEMHSAIYPTWLAGLALSSFVAIFLGFVVAVMRPSIIPLIFAAIGLLGVILTARMAKVYSAN